MSEIKALFLDKASLYPDDLDFSKLELVANWQWFDNANASDIRSDLEQAEIIVSNKVELNRATLQVCKKLRLICVAATGVNNVDVAAARQMGVQICNVQAYATASVTQHVFSLILSLNRKLSLYKKLAIDGSWSQSEYFCLFDQPVSDLENKTLGVIGYGELGKAVEKVALCLGMNVQVAESHQKENLIDPQASAKRDRVDMETLLMTSDIVSLHCPLTSDNHHMISNRELSMMKNSALLINTARGGLIDEAALLDALEKKLIAGAGLDVLEQEPPKKNNILFNYAQLHENLIVTPHIAWASQQARQNLINQLAENIHAFQVGKHRNIIV